MQKSKAGCSGRGIAEKALSIDQFGRPFEFMLPNRQRKYKTLCGSIMSIVMLLVIGFYSAYKY